MLNKHDMEEACGSARPGSSSQSQQERAQRSSCSSGACHQLPAACRAAGWGRQRRLPRRFRPCPLLRGGGPRQGRRLGCQLQAWQRRRGHVGDASQLLKLSHVNVLGLHHVWLVQPAEHGRGASVDRALARPLGPALGLVVGNRGGASEYTTKLSLPAMNSLQSSTLTMWGTWTPPAHRADSRVGVRARHLCTA